MRRLFWLTLGAALGAWAVLRVQRFTRKFGPRGVAGRAAGYGAALRAFAADVQVQMHRREAELRRALDGPPTAGAPALPAGHRRTLEIHDTDKDGH